MTRLPRTYESFRKEYEKVWAAYDRLAKSSHQAGPLSVKTRALIKLAMSIAAKSEGAVHSHTRQALDSGASHQEIRHLVLLGITTIGFPSSMAALSWVEDVLKKRKQVKGQRM